MKHSIKHSRQSLDIKQSLFVACLQIEKVSTLNSNRKHLQYYVASPQGIAVKDKYLYFADNAYEKLSRRGKDNGIDDDKETVLLRNMPNINQVRVFTSRPSM